MTLYLGPIGLVLYLLSCKEPGPRLHEEFVRPLWKQGMGSVIAECVQAAGFDAVRVAEAREGADAARASCALDLPAAVSDAGMAMPPGPRPKNPRAH